MLSTWNPLPPKGQTPHQSLVCHRRHKSDSKLHSPSVPVLPSCPGSLWPHQEKKRMAYGKSNILEVGRSMYKYPWLEYPERAKGEAGMDRNRVRGKALKGKAP